MPSFTRESGGTQHVAVMGVNRIGKVHSFPCVPPRTFGAALASTSFKRSNSSIDITTTQNDLDEWIDHYNNERSHQGKICEGRTTMQTLEEGKAISREKFVAGT